MRFSDHAGILPLARHLDALARGENLHPPAGLTAQLRPYQAFGAAWMTGLVSAGFGAILADDMGLGKTVQTLALLQARREAGGTLPALLIVPTSLLHGRPGLPSSAARICAAVLTNKTRRCCLRCSSAQRSRSSTSCFKTISASWQRRWQPCQGFSSCTCACMAFIFQSGLPSRWRL